MTREPKRLYHGTTEKRLPSILKKGILTKREKGTTIRDLDGSLVKAVCLTEQYKVARAWAQRKAHETNSNPVVLVIDKRKVGFYIDMGVEATNIIYLSRYNIPKESIIKVNKTRRMSWEKFYIYTGISPFEKRYALQNPIHRHVL